MKRIHYLGSALLILLIAVLLVSGVQARDLYPNKELDPAAAAKTAPAAVVYDPAVIAGAWGASPDLLVECDPNGKLLAGLNPGGVQSTHRLNANACQAQTALDKEAALAAFKYAPYGGSCGSGVGGDTRMLKVSPATTEVRYVYLRCGKKVAEYGPPACSCGGNWRYTYDCKKPKTVYITIPCR